MPWYALPFSERQTKDALSAKYGVRGIPSLVVLDGNGELVTTEGRRRLDEYFTAQKVAEGAKSTTAKASDAAARKRGWGACSKCVVFVLVPLLAVIYPALLAFGKSVVSMPKLKVVDRFARVIPAYDCAIRPVVRR